MSVSDFDLPETIVVIPAAGSGTRFGGTAPKQFASLRGMPVIAHTVRRFAGETAVTGIIIAISADQRGTIADLSHVAGWQKVKITEGGATRQESVLRALRTIDREGDPIVAVHDAVRPFPTRALIQALLLAAVTDGASVPLLPLTDTLHRHDGDFVTETADRAAWGLAQTPQCARLSILRDCLEKALAAGFDGTDEAGILLRHGVPVRCVRGESSNIKITHPQDMTLAEAMFDVWSEG